MKFPFWTIFCVLLLGTSCSSEHEPPLIHSDGLIKMMVAEPDLQILDTRERPEFDVSHIPNGQYAGYKAFQFSDWEHLSKETPIILYCSVGKRSGEIGEQFVQNGYTNVYNLEGGIFRWMNSSNPVEDSTGNFTDRIHGYNTLFGKALTRGEVVYD